MQALKQPVPGPRRVWLHLAPHIQSDVAVALCDAILDRDPDLEILYSGRQTRHDLGDLARPIDLPPQGRAGAARLIAELHPDVVGWTDGQSDPTLIRELIQRGIPVHLFDSGNAIEASRIALTERILGSSALRHYTSITVGDAATRTALIRAGAREAQVGIRGVLELGPVAPECDPAARDRMAELLAARPVWLADRVNPEELDAILATHLQALRRAHKLLLVLVPAETSQAKQFAEALAGSALTYCNRDLGQDPEPDTQVILAPSHDEMGLWYRLAPVTFIGKTLAGRTGGMSDPFKPASLGSVVLLGPATQPHFAAFTRLIRARAARTVAHSGELALALDGLLAPDRAALMAHAAWEISTAGSGALAHAAEVIVRSAHGGAAR